jgi:hypothetical protein
MRALQESKYEEDYLSTIGVDFVRISCSAPLEQSSTIGGQG